MASGAASSRSASQLATSASAHDVDAWEKEEELAATRRAVNAIRNVPIGVGDNALWEVLRDVHFLLDSPGAHVAAKAYMLIEDVTRGCPERAQTSVKAVAKEVRDILVLRCLCEMERKDHGNRDVFVVTVAKAFGQSFSKECRDMIFHVHRKVTWGRPGALLSKTQRRGRHRRRRVRLAAQDVQLRQEMSSAVALFLEREDVSDGASGSDEAGAARPPAGALQM